MPAKFNPALRRQTLQNYFLRAPLPFEPEQVPPDALCTYLGGCVSSYAKCYWYGLANDVTPRVREIVEWMETRTPPDLAHWPREQSLYRAGHTAHFFWWLSLGLARWLVADERATQDFARAVHIEWGGWAQATRTEATRDRRGRQYYLGQRLVASLLADEPDFGIRFYNAARVRPPFNLGRPVLEFGRWASAYLAEGHARDSVFVGRGTDMFRETFLPFFWPSAAWFESTLWLKAIYFDSGVTTTAEETFFRAYDCIPEIEGPVPWLPARD